MDGGDITTANKEFDHAMNVARQLLPRGRSAADGVLALLSHANPYVRAETAFVALEIGPEQAERVLEELSHRKDLDIGFTAEYTLKMWRAGQLRTLSQWEISKRKR